MLENILNIIPRKKNSIFEAVDYERYLKANKDVEIAINNGQFESAREHFEKYGIKEVETGNRVLYPGLPLFSEKDYITDFPDVRSAISIDRVKSAFYHFIKFGSEEMLNGTRGMSGKYPRNLNEFFFDKARTHFNSEKYFLQNRHDIKNEEPWLHFKRVGAREIMDGSRLMYQQSIPYNLRHYLTIAPDILPFLRNGTFESPFEHYVFYGALEISEGRRFIVTDSHRYVYYTPKKTDRIKESIKNLKIRPKISVVMPTYNVDPYLLDLAYKSIESQWYENWELCICDDASTNIDTIRYLKKLKKSDNRVNVSFSKKNKGIAAASNQALKLAKGDFIALMDNDDEITPDAFFEVVKHLNQSPDIDFFYSDEDKIDESGYVEPHFKPDFNHEMFFSHNYISHLGVIRTSLLNKVNGWREGFDGAQDYELYLRVLEKTDNIKHIPKVLYHWRKVEGSTASNFGEKSFAYEAGRLALEAMLCRRGISAKAEFGLTIGTYRIRYTKKKNPLVSIIIPFKDKPDLLDQCLNSLVTCDDYKNIEIICIDNNSTDRNIVSIKHKYQELDKRIKFHSYKKEFNYSAINNYAVKNHCRGEYIVLMNNDIEVKNTDWLSSLLELGQLDSTGAVGAKLLYPDNTIQHAGLVICPDTSHGIVSPFKRNPANAHGYFSRPQCISNYSAVTAALLLVKTSKYLEVGGLDEEDFKIAYNDVDLCLKLQNAGYRNIYTPFCIATHYESASRGLDVSSQKISRMRSELANLRRKHPNIFKLGDPTYSRNINPQFDDIILPTPELTEEAEKYQAKEFSEEVIFEKSFNPVTRKNVCLFSHYDKDGLIDEYVIHYLEFLKSNFDIIFISTSEKMSIKESEKIRNLASKIIVKKNHGYDFGAWKTGMDRLPELCESPKNILLCNDSVYGPINDFRDFVEHLENPKADIFGVSDSFEIDYHMQSYFMCFSEKVINSDTFKEFWLNFKIYEDKSTLIIKNEVGLSRILMDKGFTFYSVVPSIDLGFLNNMHHCWDSAITKYSCPFVKIELLKVNPVGVDISNFRKVAVKDNEKMASMITNHLKRVSENFEGLH